MTIAPSTHLPLPATIAPSVLLTLPVRRMFTRAESWQGEIPEIIDRAIVTDAHTRRVMLSSLRKLHVIFTPDDVIFPNYIDTTKKYKKLRPRTKLRGRFLTHKVDGLISLDWQKKSAAWRKKMCRAAEKWKSAARQIFARHIFFIRQIFLPVVRELFRPYIFLNFYALPALFFLNIFDESWPTRHCQGRFLDARALDHHGGPTTGHDRRLSLVVAGHRLIVVEARVGEILRDFVRGARLGRRRAIALLRAVGVGHSRRDRRGKKTRR